MVFKLFRRAEEPKGDAWQRHWSPAGIHITSATSKSGGVAIDDPMVGGFLTQLVDDGHAVEAEDGYLLGWDGLYTALNEPAYAQLPELLQLPRFTDTRPALRSSHALTDHDFSIAIAGWLRDDGSTAEGELVGPVLDEGARQSLLSPQQWSLFKDVVSFSRRPDTERDDLSHRQAWGRIRKLAQNAGARLDDFLYRSVVLTPEKLEIGLRRSDAVIDDRVIEIEPRFEGAPADWLEAFDRSKEVRDRYDIVTPEGIIQVLITPKVRTVLQEVKRLPGRRVAGSRAQAFLLNPFATLGDDAVDVIEETQFEKAREDAGLDYERFTPVFERDASGYPQKIGLLIETAVASGPTSSETQWLNDSQLNSFIEVRDYVGLPARCVGRL